MREKDEEKIALECQVKDLKAQIHARASSKGYATNTTTDSTEKHATEPQSEATKVTEYNRQDCPPSAPLADAATVEGPSCDSPVASADKTGERGSTDLSISGPIVVVDEAPTAPEDEYESTIAEQQEEIPRLENGYELRRQNDSDYRVQVQSRLQKQNEEIKRLKEKCGEWAHK